MHELTALKKGSEAAFVNVYYEFHKKVFRFFLKRTNNHEIARELAQEAFIKLWKGRRNLSESYPIDTQLFTIAGSTLVDHFRRQAQVRKRMVPLQDKAGEELVSPGSGSLRSFEAVDYLKVVVRDLPPARKKIILLKMAAGYTNKEIAAELSISEKTVEDHVTKALRHIRALHPLLFLLLTLHC
jgi:RNA polymerase sigma factor (sigma-70 family)